MAEQPAVPDGGDHTAPSDDVAPSRSGPAGSRRRRDRAWRSAALLMVLALALTGLAVSAAGIADRLLPRRFTAAQQQQIMAWETAGRWRIMTAGQIFPATIGYQLSRIGVDSASGLSLVARRLGIAPQASCGEGADLAAAQVLNRYGCTAVLRATYADSTGSLLLTIGVAVLPDSEDAASAARALAVAPAGARLGPSVRAAAVPGTVAARFADRTRQLAWSSSVGPYVILSTVGFADGRPWVRISADSYVEQEMQRLADGIVDTVSAAIGQSPAVPRCPGAPGC